MSTHGVVHEWLIAEFSNLDFQRGKIIRDFPFQNLNFVTLAIINFATISKEYWSIFANWHSKNDDF